jgi:hypothetical protein
MVFLIRFYNKKSEISLYSISVFAENAEKALQLAFKRLKKRYQQLASEWLYESTSTLTVA